MRRTFAERLILFQILLLAPGLSPLAQAAPPTVTVLDRANQLVSQLTDGDIVSIQVTLSGPAAQTEKINFTLANTAFVIGSCTLASGESSCTTEPFSALGWYWDEDGSAPGTRTVLAARENGEPLAQSDPVRVAPRPVVLVHGFLSNPETWEPYLGAEGFLAALGLRGFAVGDEQVPGRLNTGNILAPAERTNTVGQNAEILGQYLAAVKQKTGAQMVDLVVHSMGGMISRYYIDRVMKDRDVAQLIMLGSPMGGSDCAVLPAALGFYLPAAIEIRESYMRGVFNQQITRRHGIEFYDLGGTAILEPFKSPCTSVPNDTVVSFGSINAIPLQSGQFDVIHSELTFSAAVFEGFVQPLLQKPAGRFPSGDQPDPVSEAQAAARADPPLQFTRLYTGHVDSGGSTEITINVEAGLSVASFALYDPSRSVATVVRGASGNIIELSPEANGFIQFDDPAALFYLGYGFQNPRPGPWRITVQAGEATPPGGTDFAITVYFVGGAMLEAASSTLVPKPNEAVEFGANLFLGSQPLQISAAQALIRDADGNVQTLNFPSGQNISATWTPTNPGAYAVDILVTGLAPDGSAIERTAFLALEVQADPGGFQITFTFLALIAVLIVILFLILFVVFRATGKLFRRSRSGKK
jgi:pimeloyl-ACP methyl ester carboxylesterase